MPGDGRYEWYGFTQFADLPESDQSPAGFFATANEMNLPADYAYDQHKLGFEWAEHSRTDRIHEVLREQNRHTLAQSMRCRRTRCRSPAVASGR